MDFLIGSITAILLIALFRLVEKKRVENLGKTTYLFFFYVVGCAMFMNPSEELIVWLITCLLLYSVLDDWTTKTLNIYLPILATLLFLLFLEKPYFFLYSFFFFLTFLIFVKWTKEKLIGEGDVYLFLPLSFLLLQNLPHANGLWIASQWVSALLLSCLLVAVVFIPLKILRKEIHDAAFGPFLVLGSLLIFQGEFWVGTLFSYLFIATIFFYSIWLLQFLLSYIKGNRSN